MTTRREPEPTPAPEPKRRPQSDARKAAAIVDKLAGFDADEAEELANTPATITAKYVAKRAALLVDESGDVAELVRKMRA